MKKQWKWLLTAAALVAVLVIAVVLYRSLSERFSPLDAATTTTAAAAPESVPAPQESAEPEETATPQELEAPASTEEQAADFIVLDQNNTQVRLSDHFGKPLVVNFWASWCSPCCRELPSFDDAAKQYDGQIEFMMVNLTDGYSETVSSVQSFLQENGYTFPVYYDTNEDAANAYNIYSIPLTVFIRPDGTMMTSHIGSMDETTLQNYLAQLLA